MAYGLKIAPALPRPPQNRFDHRKVFYRIYEVLKQTEDEAKEEREHFDEDEKQSEHEEPTEEKESEHKYSSKQPNKME